MGFSHLVNIDATIVAFKAMFDIPLDVQIQYCPEGDIENDRLLRVIFILLSLPQPIPQFLH